MRLALLFCCLIAFNISKGQNPAPRANQEEAHLDTISGYFLYEVDVPEKCYTRWDEIERGNNLIAYNENFKKQSIETAYERGIYILGYDDCIQKPLHKYQLFQNRESMDDFAGYMIRHSGEEYDASLIFDKTGILSYKKVYAKLIVCNLHNQLQLTPKMKNYKCCYSNVLKAIPTYFVMKVLEYKVY